MAATLVKNALQLSMRVHPVGVVVGVGARALSIATTERFSTALPHPSVLLMATPSHHMNALTQTPLVFETPLNQVAHINDVLPTLGELECPAESLNEPLQAIKRTYQPSVLRRKRKHGFRTRRVSISGRKLLKRRYNKGRWRMSL